MLSAPADEHQVGVRERLVAVCAAVDRRRRLIRLTAGDRPAGAADRPRDDVLEPAERRPALPGLLAEAVAVLRLEVAAAPAAALVQGWLGLGGHG